MTDPDAYEPAIGDAVHVPAPMTPADVEAILRRGLCSASKRADGPCECCEEKLRAVEVVRGLRYCETTLHDVHDALSLDREASRGEVLAAIASVKQDLRIAERERDDARADLASAEHDLAQLITLIGSEDRMPGDPARLAQMIEANGRDGWVARALSDAPDARRDVVRELRARAERAESEARDGAALLAGTERARLAAEAEVERLRGSAVGLSYGAELESEDNRALRAEVETLTREREAAVTERDAYKRERDEARHESTEASVTIRRRLADLLGCDSMPNAIIEEVESIRAEWRAGDARGEAIEAALGEHATGDTVADVRRVVDELAFAVDAAESQTERADDAVESANAEADEVERLRVLVERYRTTVDDAEQYEHESDDERIEAIVAICDERDRLRGYLARALRGCDARERHAIEADMLREASE